MSRIHEIPVIVVARPPANTASCSSHPAILAIINEIDAKLKALLDSGDESVIDLRWLLGSPEVLSLLQKLLGHGEVTATVCASGNTEIAETAVPCLWWISHRDTNDRLIGVCVEIAEIPELLRSDRLAIHRGLESLHARGADLAMPDRPSSTPPM